MIAYEYDQFKEDVARLREQCAPFKADTVVAVARGGMTLAHALSMALDVRNLQSIRIESYDGDRQREDISIMGECDFGGSERVLIVDDIVDSGKTLDALLHLFRARYPRILFKTAAIYTKPTALVQPDFSLYEATEWIEFFWERPA